MAEALRWSVTAFGRLSSKSLHLSIAVRPARLLALDGYSSHGLSIPKAYSARVSLYPKGGVPSYKRPRSLHS